MNKIKLIHCFLFVLLLIFSGCGSSGDRVQTSSLSGVVAVGEALEADVVVVDGNRDYVVGRTDSSGEYTVDTSTLMAPFLIRATADDGRILYAYAAVGQNYANVTPITSYIMHQVALENGYLGGVAHLFSQFGFSDRLSSGITSKMGNLDDLLSDELSAAGVSGFNHFTGMFNADHTGYDSFLDSLDLEVVNDDIVIRIGTGFLDTLTYEVSEADVNVNGLVLNAQNDMAINAAGLEFSNAVEGAVPFATNSSGEYNATLPAWRTYDINVTATGFQNVRYYNLATFAQNSVTAMNIPMVPTGVSGDGTISGTVINARTADTMADVDVKFREGINNRDGDVVVSTLTAADGNYSTSIATGVYTVEFSRTGYASTYSTAVALSGDVTTADASLVAYSLLGNGTFATMVLTWGENPRDLDTFLTGPSSTLGSRFKLAYYQKVFTTSGSYNNYPSDYNQSNPCASSTIIAAIDLDDVSSYGPETTTICQVEEGIYSYYVHHYSGTENISTSPAQVVVTTAYGTEHTFTAPTGAAGHNDVWHVFDLDSTGNVTPVNTFMVGGGDASVRALINVNGGIDYNLVDRSYSKQ